MGVAILDRICFAAVVRTSAPGRISHVLALGPKLDLFLLWRP